MPRGQPYRPPVLVLLLVVGGALLPAGIARGETPGLSLDRAIRMSLASARVLAARQVINQARGDVETASLPPNPSLNLEGGLLPLSRSYTVEEPGGPPEISGGISYAVDWLLFGKRSAAMASAALAVKIAEAQYVDLLRRRINETTEAFYGVLEAEALVEIARQTSSDLERGEAAIRKAVASGGRPQVELNRVRLELQSARRELRTAQAALVVARTTLQALLGDDGATACSRLSGTLDHHAATRPFSVEESFAVARDNRPDLLALRYQEAKARRDEIVERRNAWPETSLGFAVVHQFQEAIGAPDVTAWGVSLEVALPIFNRNQGNRAKATSIAVEAGHGLRAALIELHAEIERVVRSLDTALENVEEMTRTDLELASQVRDSFTRAYEAGGRPLLEMLDAQRSYRETYRAFVTSRADYWRALSRYQAALGKKVIP